MKSWFSTFYFQGKNIYLKCRVAERGERMRISYPWSHFPNGWDWGRNQGIYSKFVTWEQGRTSSTCIVPSASQDAHCQELGQVLDPGAAGWEVDIRPCSWNPLFKASSFIPCLSLSMHPSAWLILMCPLGCLFWLAAILNILNCFCIIFPLRDMYISIVPCDILAYISASFQNSHQIHNYLPLMFYLSKF